MKNKFYVYFHINPIKNEVFYVGKGHGVRAHSKSKRTDFWKNMVDKYGFTVDIIHDKLSEEEAFELEMMYIKKLGRRDNGTGILVNMTDGGEGRSGLICSEETRIKISKTSKGKIPVNKGKKLSIETKKKMSESQKGNKKALGYKHTEETKKQISNSLKGEKNHFFGKTHSEETRNKIIESNKKRKGEKRK
jgi:hypothetical protein